MRNRNYPIIIGADNRPKKIGIGTRDKHFTSGADIMIFNTNDNETPISLCTQLHFCTIESLSSFIKLLEETKKIWENNNFKKTLNPITPY